MNYEHFKINYRTLNQFISLITFPLNSNLTVINLKLINFIMLKTLANVMHIIYV